MSLIISDFSWFFFVKLQPPLKKVTPSFPATPLLKLRSCQVPSLFENLVGGSIPPTPKQKGRVHTMHIINPTLFVDVLSSILTKQEKRKQFKILLKNSQNKVCLQLTLLWCRYGELWIFLAQYSNTCQGLIQAVFDIGIPILGLNSILSKTETTIERNSSFLIKSAT